MRIPLSMGFVLLSAMSVGCTAATGAVQGGDPLFDASLLKQSFTGPSSMGGADAGDGAPPATTNVTSAACLDGGMNGGSSWTDLYTCYFGTTGPDSCAGSPGSCHMSGSDPGGAVWICGTTAASCYQGMTGYKLPTPTSGSDPTSALLYTVLCKADMTACSQPTDCLMPLGCPEPPSVQLYPDDMARIAAWISMGAPEN
jgi:hypothetical protein